MPSAHLWFVLACLGLTSWEFGQVVGASAQTPAATALAPVQTEVKMPTEPAALLALGAKKNGLQNAGGEPLHVKASYQLLDDAGGIKETGTFDELRISARKYKLIYSSPSFSQTAYSTDSAVYRVGSPGRPDGLVWAAHDSLYPNFPLDGLLGKSKVGLSEKKAGAQLKCVTLDNKTGQSPAYDAIYCFNPTAPILRIAETFHGAQQTVYNGIVSIRGAYVARDITFWRLGKERVRVHLDAVDEVPAIKESDFVPPAGAAEVPRQLTGGSAAMPGKSLHKVAPMYPMIAKAARVQGTVVVQAVIGRDGRILDLRPIAGPAMLMQSAVDAVRQWTYEPSLVDGEPVEVVVEINVVFALGFPT